MFPGLPCFVLLSLHTQYVALGKNRNIPLHVSTMLSHSKRRSAELPHRLIRYSCIFVARMSPALNGSSALQHFEHGNTVEIHKGMMFDFYPGLPGLWRQESGTFYPGLVTLSPIYSSYWQYSMSSVRSISVFLKNCSNTTFFFSSSPPLNACVKEIWKKEKLAVYWHVPVLYT